MAKYTVYAMTKSMKNLTKLIAWQALSEHQQQIAPEHMRDWFDQDTGRFNQYCLEVGDLFLDYSRNRIDQQTIELLCELAHAIDLNKKIHDLCTGQTVNLSENRAAFHTALRDPAPTALTLNGANVAEQIAATKAQMRALTTSIHDQTWRGATGKPIAHVVNIGIGGSYLGPLFTTYALNDFAITPLQFHFIANVDKSHLDDVLQRIDPETTLFIISSKSFTTLETLTNARTIRDWMTTKIGSDLTQHFIAITAATDKAIAFGIPSHHILPLWEWVGGRYSVWSAIGLPLMLMIGPAQFAEFLNGAHEMDQHFQQADFSQNMPVLMALLGIWYTNFFAAPAQAIVPYAHRLRYLIPYLQQAEMESNGKSLDQHGNGISHATSPVIFGEEGCNGQHTFHQLLHQGQQCIPVDFIFVATPSDKQDEHHHAILTASAISQANALMRGKTEAEANAELANSPLSPAEAAVRARHRTLPGNRPSNMLLLKRITPSSVGALLALYEHKIFVQGAIWGINSFDQWGVELGKELLPDILQQLLSESPSTAATHGIIHQLNKVKAHS